MKLRILALCLLLCSLLSLTAFASKDKILLRDDADVLTPSEETAVLEELNAISTDLNIMVATVGEETRGDMWAIAKDIFDRTGWTDGMILLWRRGTAYNEYYFLPVGEGETIFDDSVLDELEGECVDYLREKRFAEAFLTYVDVCEEAIADYGRVKIMPILLCVLIGAALSFAIPMSVLKGQLKSVRSVPAAQSYVRSGSFSVTKSRDIFLYRNVVRRAKPKNNSSGGGGGGGRAGRGGRC